MMYNIWSAGGGWAVSWIAPDGLVREQHGFRSYERALSWAVETLD